MLQDTFTIIANSNFTRNFAYGRGGALYILDQVLQLNFTSFVDNYVTPPPSSAYFTEEPVLGGAMYISPSTANSVLDRCLFSGNLASSGWGGAIYGVYPDSVCIFPIPLEVHF